MKALQIVGPRRFRAGALQFSRPSCAARAPSGQQINVQLPEESSGFCRLRPFMSVRPVPRHSRQMTHLGSSGASGADHCVHPDPPQIEQRAFSGISLSCWGIG
jgi:hypothetical protein